MIRKLGIILENTFWVGHHDLLLRRGLMGSACMFQEGRGPGGEQPGTECAVDVPSGQKEASPGNLS